MVFNKDFCTHCNRGFPSKCECVKSEWDIWVDEMPVLEMAENWWDELKEWLRKMPRK